MQMMASFAELEREMIRDRTKAGLDAARAEGRVGGRRPKLRENHRKDIIENILSGKKTGVQTARRNVALVQLMLQGGLRISETTALTHGDLQIKSRSGEELCCNTLAIVLARMLCAGQAGGSLAGGL